MHWLCVELWRLAPSDPSSLGPHQPPTVPPPINTSQEYIVPSSSLLLVLFPFDSVVPLPLLVFPIPSAEIPKVFQLEVIDMSPAGDDDQCFRECKGSVRDSWTVESRPIPEWDRYRSPEGICLMRNEKADWSLQRQALNQSYVPRDGFVSFFTPVGRLRRRNSPRSKATTNILMLGMGRSSLTTPFANIMLV